MPIFGNLLQRMAADSSPPDAIHVDEQDHYNDEWTPPFDLRDVVRIRTNQKFTDHYILYEEIGEGKFGKVFRCVEKETNLELAAKCIKLKKDTDLAKVEKEINIMTQMRHRCIAQIYDSFQISAQEIVLIMEFVSGGELFDRVVEDNFILTETAVAIIMYQICEAIRYIHSQKILHLDLKPENIMCVSLSGNQVKLIDFGLAQFYDGQKDLLFMAGTPEFAAPEVIKYEPLDFHTDMWSLGVIAYILMSGQSPFLGDNIALTYCNVEKGNWSFCEEFDENGISDEARDFITKLLIVDKNKRMLPEECLQHPWITKSLERARSKSFEEKPLDTAKLKSYVKNKRFRRLVFGVLFINSVTRMLSTLQAKKSENGIQYVQNMLNATVENGGANAAQSLVKSAFAKRRRNVTGEADQNALTADKAASEQPSTSQEGNELHRKPKRSNNNHAATTDDETPSNAVKDLLSAAKRVESAASKISEHNADSKNVLDVPVPFDDGASSPEASRTASPARIKRQRDKAKPKSSGSRKASSSEQAAKKPKQGSGSTLKLDTTVDAQELPKESPKSSTKEQPKESTKVGGILAKFQQQQTDQPFTLPVASFVPLKKPTEPDTSSVTVTLTRPEDGRKPSLKIAEDDEKPVKVKKLKKVSSKKAKSNSITIELKPADKFAPIQKLEKIEKKTEAKHELSKIEAAKKELERKMDRKSAEFLLDSTPKKPDDSKPRNSLVSALLQRLEQNDVPPMAMAVSSFIPTPKVETAVETKPKSKVLRIEPIETEDKNGKPKSGTTSVQVLNLEKKVVSERKTKLKQKDRVKKMASGGDSTQTKSEQEKQSTCELSIRQKTVTNQAGAESKVERERVKLANSVTTKEKGETEIAGVETKRHVMEKSLESVASIDLQKSTREGKKLKKKQLAISEEETTKTGIDALTAAKQQLKRVNGTAENKLLQRVAAYEDGEKAGSVQFKAEKSMMFSSDSNGHAKVDQHIRFSIDDDVLKFKELMNKRHSRKQERLAQQQSVDGYGKSSSRMTSSSSLLDENDDDSLLQAQQDAFDFSLLKSKLESRLTGRHDSEDSVINENYKQKEQNMAEIRSRLSDTGNIKRAMNKWMELDKAQNK
ncbi:Stretchin-Mlck [Aphelenchoides bicaudatus]|nr:Stretchin-Mlck [Aphelenchoides bicaudatus]